MDQWLESWTGQIHCSIQTQHIVCESPSPLKKTKKNTISKSSNCFHCFSSHLKKLLLVPYPHRHQGHDIHSHDWNDHHRAPSKWLILCAENQTQREMSTVQDAEEYHPPIRLCIYSVWFMQLLMPYLHTHGVFQLVVLCHPRCTVEATL